MKRFFIFLIALISSLQIFAQPVNDDCTTAVPLSVNTCCTPSTYSTIGATASISEINPTCGNYGGGDVWFQIVVPASGHIIINTQVSNSGADASMAIYSGTCGALTQIQCDDNGSGANPSIENSSLTPGSTVYIRYWINGGAAGSNFNICVMTPTIEQPCTNLGFENGAIGWLGTLGNSIQGPAGAATPTYVPALWCATVNSDPNFTLMTGGTDPFGGFPCVYSGGASLRIGDQATTSANETYNAASAQQTFLVDTTNTKLTIHYAAVLQDGGHNDNQQPFFTIEVLDPNGAEIECAHYIVTVPYTGFILQSNNRYYKPWSEVNVNLTAYVGQAVTVRFTTSDCDHVNLGGHFGYAYVDCSCAPYGIVHPDTICLGQYGTLSAPPGADSYLWSTGQNTQSISVNPSSDQTYYVTITETAISSCTNVLSTHVFVRPFVPATSTGNSPICVGQTINLTSAPNNAISYSWVGPNGFSSNQQNPSIPNTTPPASGVYTVTVVKGGCTSTSQVTINFNASPTVTCTTSPSSICVGQTSSLTASGAATYTWMPGNLTGSTVSVQPTGNTTYTVTGSNSNGCTNSTTITVMAYPNPALTVTANPTSICAGTQSTLDVVSNVPGTIYAWLPGGSPGSTITVTPTVTTIYTVYGNSLGCTGSASVTVTVNPSLSITPTATPSTICSGSSTTLSANSSVSGAVFTWNPGNLTGSSVTVSPASTTTYTVFGNASGCTGTATITVTVNPNPVISASASPLAICLGGSSTLTGTSSFPGTIYSWMPGSLPGSPVTVTPTSTTTYTVTGTAVGCTGTATVTITIKPNPILTPVATPDTICVGASSILTVNSDISGTTFFWSPGNMGGSPVTVTPIITTTYTVTGTALGCSGSNSVTVTVNPILIITPTATPSTICNGSSSTLQANSNVPGANYTWNPGNLTGPSVVVTPLTTTIYTVLGNASGCTGTATVTVTVNPNTTVTAVANLPAICIGSSSTLTASSDITGTTYTWMPDNSTNNPFIVSPTTTTTYTVTGSAAGCTGSTTVTVTVNPKPVVSATALPAIICSGANDTLTGHSDITGTLFHWLPGSNLNGTTVIVNPTSTTIYSVTGTTPAGCTASSMVTVTVNPNPVLTPTATPNSICLGDSTSIVVVSNVPSTSFNWSPGGMTGTPVEVKPAITTIYTINGNALGCTGSATVTVTVNPNPVVSATASPSTICNGSSSSLTGSSSISGTTYVWNPPSGGISGSPISVSPTSTTTYTVTGTAAGCKGTNTVTVTVNPNAVLTATANPTSICAGSSSILHVNSNLTGTSFIWNPGGLTDTTITVTPNATTIYTVTGSAAGCSGTTTVTVTVNANPVITLTATPPQVCKGSSSSISASSSVSGSTYTWMPGGMSGTPVVVTPDTTTTYTVTGTANGCLGSSTVTVTVNPIVTATPSQTNVLCYGDHNGSASVVVITGTAPYTYLWSNGGGAPVNSGLPANTYSVIITDIKGCDTVYHFTITQPPLITLNLNPVNENCLNYCDGSIGSVVNGGSGNISYTWSTTPVAHTSGITDLCAGAYSLTVTDTNGCTKTSSATILTVALINASFTADPVSGIVPLTVGFNFTGSGGATYTWDFGDGSNSTLQNPSHIYSTPGTYTVIVTANSGPPANCIDTASFKIVVSPPPSIIVPNVFTPNGDASNDRFIIKAESVESLTCAIFDRWGKKINEFTDPAEGWDGKTKAGAPSADGVYYYVIDAIALDGKPIPELHGTVTLLR